MASMTRREFVRSLALTSPLVALAGCGGGGSSSPRAPVRAVQWPEAEALFHQEPRWLGGDGVYSIDLGQGRVLWMFGDSFIATSSADKRSEAKIVRNSLAIQTGYDPATASMRFYWTDTGNGPDAFFIDPGASKWFWPAHGVRIGNTLLIFLSETQPSTGGLGFAGSGWKAAAVDNPDATPDAWHVRYLDCPNAFSLAVGSAVLVVGNYLYAYSHSDVDNSIYLARFTLADAAQGILTNVEWYDGAGGWALQSSLSRAPALLMGNGQAEFNVYPNPPHAPFLQVQTIGFGAAALGFRTAGAPIGAWTGPQQFYRPPEDDRSDIMVYSAKMHPMLVAPGADFVASYSTNSTDFNTLIQDTSLYYPRFVKASRQQ